jgi:hypothetical protein
VFNKDGQLLTYIGMNHGELPGQFKALVGVAIDKKNRVFTAEQFPGRVQMFQYVTDAEAEVAKKKKEEELQKAADRRQKAAGGAPADAPAAKTPAATAPAAAKPPAQ